jgi:hypothetical protein
MIDSQNKVMATVSNDRTIGVHRLGEESLIKKTLFKIEISEKANDIQGTSYQDFFLADLSTDISRVQVRF